MPQKRNDKWFKTDATQGNYNTVVILAFKTAKLMQKKERKIKIKIKIKPKLKLK